MREQRTNKQIKQKKKKKQKQNLLMRQSDKCVSVRNDDIFNLHLGSSGGPCVSMPCLLQDTSLIF